MKNTSGFTVIELLLAISIFSVISVAALYMVFSSLSLRDQTLASTRVQEQLRVLTHNLRVAVQNSSAVSGGGNSLLLTSAEKCWSFVYDINSKNLKYSTVENPGCTPDPSPSTNFFPPTTQITTWNFSINPLPTGGRQISVSGNLKSTLPFDTYQLTFSDTYTNLID